MSRGHGGYAHLMACDENTLLYIYCAYNANNNEYKIFEKMEDGEIIIERSALVEPDIHTKLKKMPSGRKKIIQKRLQRDVSYDELFASEKIMVKNASGTWLTNEGVDIMALHIIRKIFNEYQKEGKIPNSISWFS